MSRCAWGMVLLIAVLGASPAAAEDLRSIFDGKTVDGWVIDGAREYKDKDGNMQPNWKVEDGLIVTAGRGFGFLRYDKMMSYFRFKAECRLSPKSNTGFCIRCVPFDPKKDATT